MEPTTADILAEASRARADLNTWLGRATAADFRRRSNGIRWTNEELRFHMVFGYMVVRTCFRLSTSSAGSPNPPVRPSLRY